MLGSSLFDRQNRRQPSLPYCVPWTLSCLSSSHQFTMNGLPCSLTNDLSGEKIQYDGQIEPALPGTDVGDISHPNAVRLRNIEISLYQIWDEFSRLTSDISTRAISWHSTYIIFPHEPGNPVFASGFPSFPEVEKYARRAMHALAGLDALIFATNIAGFFFLGHFSPRSL
jgi:hypothetical protein